MTTNTATEHALIAKLIPHVKRHCGWDTVGVTIKNRNLRVVCETGCLLHYAHDGLHGREVYGRIRQLSIDLDFLVEIDDVLKVG